ncbi:MAG TPA: L-threonylcarbamoyladenylate synthase [Candidatus Sulfotelmatobacter sp.]|jgi:L-threonylcarbamoyladenylate synthase|nr:L-threonylcarbamoyladenylate synthase [Candidatus Sulfotelmatobacter sp.]
MDDITKAIHIIKNGGIVIFPTDTAFGMGCRIDDEAAVRRLFTIRKRAETKAVPVLVSSLSMAQQYLQEVSTEVIERLVKPYWPGALTIVLPCRTEKVTSLVRGGTKTLGVRMPDHLTTLALINGVGIPMVGTSANFAGEKTPYTFEDIDKKLITLVDFVVPGECHTRLSSTVIDCTNEPWKILRQGAVKVEV